MERYIELLEELGNMIDKNPSFFQINGNSHQDYLEAVEIAVDKLESEVI